MNQLGTERTEDRQGGRGFTVMGRRKRFRLVMRLEAKARGSVIMGDEEIRARNEEKKTRHKEESKRRGNMMAMATRLARRPWKKHEQEEAEKTKTGKEVIGMKRDKQQTEEIAARNPTNNGHAEQKHCYDEPEETHQSAGRCSLYQCYDELGDDE